MDSAVGGSSDDLFAGRHKDAVPEVTSEAFGASLLCPRFSNAGLLLVVFLHIPFWSRTHLVTVLNISQLER